VAYVTTREDATKSFQCNMGRLDRAVRLLIGCALLYITLVNTGLIANQVIRYVLVVLGGVNVVTAFIAYCPMYTLANISTKGRPST
jgi:hypothetical protein